MLWWHSDLFQPLSWTGLDLLWEAWEYYCFNPVSLTLLLFLVRKGKSLHCRYCSFSLAPSCSVEFVIQVRQPLFCLSFSQALLNPNLLNKAQNNAHSFYSPILPSNNWFWPLMLHETTKPDLQFNLKTLLVKRKKIFPSSNAKHESRENHL